VLQVSRAAPAPAAAIVSQQWANNVGFISLYFQ